MQYRTLGRTGIQVSNLCLGAMMFGHYGRTTPEESIPIIHRALDAGINFIDTADEYSKGESEEIVGKAVAGRRDDVIIATKLHQPMSDKLNERGSTRRWITRAVEGSLRRLNTDYIDLYQVHRPDPLTDIEDTLSVLNDLVRAGKVRMIGGGTLPPSYIVEAHHISTRSGYERLRCNQPPYSIFVRGIEREVLPVCERYGMGVITWSPLNSGYLTGRYRHGVENPTPPRGEIPINRKRDEEESELGKPQATYAPLFTADGMAHTSRKLDLVEDLLALADEAGMTLTHLAVAFVLQHPSVTSAIIGPRTMEHLETQIDAHAIRLGDDVLDRIDALVPPGSDITPAESGYLPPEITDPWRRRRYSPHPRTR